MLRTKAEFSSSLPDDSVEDERGFVVLPGKNVAEALSELLAGIGCEVEPVGGAGDHGWDLHFRRGEGRFYCELSIIDGGVAQFENMGVRASSARSQAAFAELLTELSSALHADGRFHQIGWFTRAEVTSQQAGAGSPSGAYSHEPCHRSIGTHAGEGEWAPPMTVAPRPEAPPGGRGGWSDLHPYPLRRWVARLFDFYLVTAVLVAALTQVPPGLGRALIPDHIDLMWLLPVRIPVAILVNTLLLAWTATTPGKWLCGVKIVRVDGRRLSFAEAIRREARAVYAGCAFYLPLVSLILMGLNGRRLLAQESAAWDGKRGLVAVQRSNSLVQQLLTFAAFVSLAGLYFWLAIKLGS
jgi:uncharacterized RDD family membrane protein YckC